MANALNKIFTKQKKKYIFTELGASLIALAASTASAVISEKLTDYDIVISIVSAVGGTTGFVIGFLIIFALLNIRQYIRKNRSFGSDMKNIFRANLHGVLAMYAFRIPFQYILQKFDVTPAYAACISQFLSGLIATAVRFYHNYKAKILEDS